MEKKLSEDNQSLKDELSSLESDYVKELLSHDVHDFLKDVDKFNEHHFYESLTKIKHKDMFEDEAFVSAIEAHDFAKVLEDALNSGHMDLLKLIVYDSLFEILDDFKKERK